MIFMAVFDLFMTPTAQMADLVFPAASFLENMELIDYGRRGYPHLGLIRPVASSGMGWPTWKFLFRLAGALGLGRLLPWDENRDALMHRLSGSGITLDDLHEQSVRDRGISTRKNADKEPGTRLTEKCIIIPGPWKKRGIPHYPSRMLSGCHTALMMNFLSG